MECDQLKAVFTYLTPSCERCTTRMMSSLRVNSFIDLVVVIVYTSAGMMSPKKGSSMPPKMSGGFGISNNHTTIGVVP